MPILISHNTRKQVCKERREFYDEELYHVQKMNPLSTSLEGPDGSQLNNQSFVSHRINLLRENDRVGSVPKDRNAGASLAYVPYYGSTIRYYADVLLESRHAIGSAWRIRGE